MIGRVSWLGIASLLLAGGVAWANMPDQVGELSKQPTSQPASQPTSQPATGASSEKAKMVALGIGATMLALGGGLYLVRRIRH